MRLKSWEALESLTHVRFEQGSFPHLARNPPRHLQILLAHGAFLGHFVAIPLPPLHTSGPQLV